MERMTDIPIKDAQQDQVNDENQDQQPPLQLPELSEVDMLSSKIVELEATINQSRDQLLRKAAEFENYKKRVENDSLSLMKFFSEELIVKLLPVIDDFERSMKANKQNASSENSNESSFMKGMELIHAKFKKLLESQGVKHFEVVGKPFDPELHDALLLVPRSDVEPHTVVEEVDKGYMLHEKVIRHARVIVSSEPNPDNGKASETGGAA